MELLDRFGAKATFFSIGMWAEREPGLLREMHAAGHAIGNHTFTHPTMPLLSSAEVKDELRRCRAAVEASGIEFSRANGGMLMRPPYGRRRPGTLRAMREEGYEPVTWSVTCYDWRRTATERSIARHAAHAGPGDIILMHDGNNLEPDADRSRSVAATEDTLEPLRGRGLRVRHGARPSRRPPNGLPALEPLGHLDRAVEVDARPPGDPARDRGRDPLRRVGGDRRELQQLPDRGLVGGLGPRRRGELGDPLLGTGLGHLNLLAQGRATVQAPTRGPTL